MDLGHLFASRLLLWIPLVLSLGIHEWAHAWAATQLGDDTARLQGRLTMNPIAHLDWVGTVLLPLLGVPFGWAKPVPFSPARFRRGVSLRAGIFMVAFAGPLSNLVLALLCLIVVAVIASVAPGVLLGSAALRSLFETFFLLNVLLAFFNLLPIPPLDGGRIVDTMIPTSLRRFWDAFCQHSMWILLVVLLFLAFAAGPLLSGFLQGVIGILRELYPV